ncbi:HlyD family efflux transporter periplasmic adaptor subunit [Terasakiella sp. SH-1]|uniref:efflux RND transporter periplasmic adaptor subunit n=1 Tax=Terasakiella sp. SH-1 TaxID=2560057 RepID=UPI0010735E75|nr:HlyD family efflux transporter periplasmic adaptor subunit [Terasakiella sp. SH-1]
MNSDVCLHLLERIQQAQSEKEAAFIALNETYNLSPYRQAIQCAPHGDVEAVSGSATLESHAPFIQYLKKLCRHLIEKKQEKAVIGRDDLPKALWPEWGEWMAERLLWVPIYERRTFLGACLFIRDLDWSEQETAFLQLISQTLFHRLALFQQKKGTFQFSSHFLKKKKKLLSIGVLMFLVGFIPVPLSVLCPAEVVPYKPQMVRAALDGIIKTIHVQPNQQVSKGTLLLELDDEGLQNKVKIAKQALQTAETELEQIIQQSFFDPRVKAQQTSIKGRIAEHKTEIHHLEDVLNRTKVFATQNGVAVLGDPSLLIGRPVSIGEKVMSIADENKVEIQAYMSVGEAIDLKPGNDVSLFLNIDPTQNIAGKVRYAAYKAYPQADGTMAYGVRASLNKKQEIPRLGLKGTARIQSGRVSLFYWIFRRPLGVIRQTIGL